ncbi:MAG: SDR family oxidoreductase [Myxococcales bacterium]|nr:SDR family oxidoreductase [Myxococcales bacterium]MDH3485285.1 SDR family oxidoreductase [Myxococcales bacterium]
MKTAVVTGAGKGLGRRIAGGLADKGFAVLVTDVDEAAAKATAAAIGPQAWSMQQDVRDPASHRAVAKAAEERGSLKLWVNNAGVLTVGPAWELDEDTVRQHVDVNLLGVVWGSRAAVDCMRVNGGHIINIASLSALAPVPGLAVYAATKSAVLGYSISLQGDLAQGDLPIKVSAVCPDAIDTDLVRDVAHHRDASLLFSASKLLTVEQVGDAVLDLVDNPKLVVTMPRRRAMLAHVLRPFPTTGLRLLEPFRRAGERRLEALKKR